MVTTQYIEVFEWIAVIAGILFIILMIVENIWTWCFGIVSSVILVYIMYSKQLYSESLLYVIYSIIGIYGWYSWSSRSAGDLPIRTISLTFHMVLIGFGLVLTGILGTIMKNFMTDSYYPYCDAFSSIFGLIASYMEAQKWLSAWIFWIFINAFTIWLYMSRELNITSVLMIVYFILSIVGYFSWRRKYFLELQTQK